MGTEKESNKTLRICGSGSVRKNKGRWQAVVSLIDEKTGERTQRTRNTGIACLSESTRGKKAALDALAEFRSDIEAELTEIEELRVAAEERQAKLEADDYALLPLGAALEKFIDFCLQMNRITPTTRDDYHFSALHIERDELGRIPVNEVTTDDVNAWSARRIALGCAPDTLNKAFKLGKRLYTVLIKRSNDTIGKNPFDGALAPRIIGRPRNALRSDLVPKLNSICSMMPDSRFKRAVVLALHTGMRIGEVCALRWCDVDFESGLITVRHSVAYAKGMGSFIKDTKTHDLRSIPIDPVGLLPFLKETHEIDCGKLRLRGLTGAVEIGDCYILSEPGATFATTSYIRRAFKTFSETNALMGTNDELITFHGLVIPSRRSGSAKAGTSRHSNRFWDTRTPWSPSTSTLTSSRFPRSTTCCASRPAFGAAISGFVSTRAPCSNNASRRPSRRSRHSGTASPSRMTEISSYAM